MKIWLDIANPAEARFLHAIGAELTERGHQLFVTTRENSIPVLQLLGFKDYVLVEGHGKNLVSKAIKTNLRTVNLVSRIPHGINRLFSVESVSATLASKLLGIRSVLFTDNEKAKIQCYLGYNFADRIIAPNLIPESMIESYLFFSKEIISVPGLKEQTYVKKFKPDKRVLEKLSISKDSRLIVVRPEPGLAAYSKNVQKNFQILVSACKEILKNDPNSKIIFIPRYDYQRSYLKRLMKELIIPEGPLDTLSLIYYSNWVVCAGDTMAREAILLRKPTIICYTGDLVITNTKLIESEAAFFSVDPYEIADIISSDRTPSFELIKSLKDPTEDIIRAILTN